MLRDGYTYDGMNKTAEVLAKSSQRERKRPTSIATWPQMAHLHHVHKMIKVK
jgi:hypothetical protein